MGASPLIQGLFDYHWWANRRLWDVTAALGEEAARREVGRQFSAHGAAVGVRTALRPRGPGTPGGGNRVIEGATAGPGRPERAGRGSREGGVASFA